MNLENSRVAVTEALIELAKKDSRILLVSSDSLLVIKGRPFAEQFPKQYIEVGIAEQCAVGSAAGLAACGLTPFYTTYAGFITMRAIEQVRTFVAYPELNVKMIGANGGILSGEREGVTHQFFEDIGILRTIPGMTILVPSNAEQVKCAVRLAAEEKGPFYIRIGSGRDAVHPINPKDFELGKARIVKEIGKDLAIFASGFVFPWVMKASEVLQEMGIKTTIVEVNTLKPVDTELIENVLSECGAAVTVEDHSIIGGLGSVISKIATDTTPVPVNRIGLKDVFPRSGKPLDLIAAYKMGSDDIVSEALSVIGRKKK